jgi:hypothetical protein
MKRNLLELLLVVFGYAVVTTIVLYPLPFHLSTLVYNPNNGDGQFSVWNIGWVARTLIADPAHLFDANIFYPHRWTLAYSEMNLAAGALAVPVYWGTRSAYAAHNFAVLSSFVLGATSMYYLCRELTGDRRAAVVGGLLFGFCPHLFAHLPHIQLLMTSGIPLSLLALHRVIERPTSNRGAMLGLALAWQAYACAYYSVFVLLMVGFAVLLIPTLRRSWRNAAYWEAVGVGAVVSVTATVPLLMAALYLQQSGFNRTLEASRQYVADWRAYLASGNLLHSWMLTLLGSWKEVLFPGFLAVGLGITGIVLCWRAGGKRRELAILYGTLTVGALWASFGPDGGLYTLLYQVVPTFSMLRAPSRFGLVVAFGLAVLASLATAALLSRSRRPVILSGVLIAAAFSEALVPVAFGPVLEPSPAYSLLATLPDGPVLELPVYSHSLGFRRSRYMLDSTVHWKPLVDAYSDHIPADFEARAEALADFPSLTALRDMKRDRVRYAVIHLDPYTSEMRSELLKRTEEFAQYLRPLYRDREVLMYEVVGYPD